ATITPAATITRPPTATAGRGGAMVLPAAMRMATGISSRAGLPRLGRAPIVDVGTFGGVGMHVIGAGVGRTGTYSLKVAINRLGLGPCHHMEAVLQNMPQQVPLWQAALDGRADWSAIYADFESAVDWPTA